MNAKCILVQSQPRVRQPHHHHHRRRIPLENRRFPPPVLPQMSQQANQRGDQQIHQPGDQRIPRQGDPPSFLPTRLRTIQQRIRRSPQPLHQHRFRRDVPRNFRREDPQTFPREDPRLHRLTGHPRVQQCRQSRLLCRVHHHPRLPPPALPHIPPRGPVPLRPVHLRVCHLRLRPFLSR
jgi:hypothetical protein